MTKRRGKGEGGLYQRHDHATCPPLVQVGIDAKGDPVMDRLEHRCRGRWVGNVQVVINGVERRKSVYGRTREEARAKLNKALGDKRSGTLVARSMNVAQWMTEWLDTIDSRRTKPLTPQTLRGYRSKNRTYITPQLGRHRLTGLEPRHVRDLYQWMREDGSRDGGPLAEATVRQTHAILKVALRDAIIDGKLAISPVDRVQPPGTETSVRLQLTPDQARTVLLGEARESFRWWLALFYGARQGECLGLRRCDMSWTRQSLRIHQTLQLDDAGRLIFGRPKSRMSRRELPVLPQIEARAKVHWLSRGWDLTDPYDPCPDDTVTGQCPHGLVFEHGGRPIWPNVDWAAWRDLLVTATVPPWAPIPHVALHSARGTASSVMEAAGIPDRLVMEILGHAQVRTTHGYQKADMERKREALAGVGQILEPGSGRPQLG